MTPVERAARAFEPDVWEVPNFLDTGSAIQKRYIAERQQLSLARTRRALETMLEPSEAMLKAGSAADALTIHYGPDDYTKEATKVWQAMLRAALEEKAP